MDEGRQSELGPDEHDEHAARLNADAEMFALLQKHRFKGPLYEKWVTTLVDDTSGRLWASIQSGRAFADPRTGRFVTPTRTYQQVLMSDRHEALSLALSAIALTLPRFRRDALLEGGWNPSRGATLQQYFYGAVLQTLPQAYRRWKRDHKHIGAGERLLSESHDPRESQPRADPPSRLEQTEDFHQVLLAVPEKDRKVAVLLFEGFPIRQIAEELGMSSRDVSKAKQRIKTALSRAGYRRRRR